MCCKPILKLWQSILLLVSLVLVSLPALCSVPVEGVDPVTEGRIKHHWQETIPAYPWQLGIGQAYQESRYKMNAVSPAGARGLFQFMRPTWSDMQKQGVVPYDAKPEDPRWATKAGAVYMARLLKMWKSPRPAKDRYYLALASYNAGAGNILAAQKRCRGASGYDEIMVCLPQITGAHAKETLGYAPAIQRHTDRFIARRDQWKSALRRVYVGGKLRTAGSG